MEASHWESEESKIEDRGGRFIRAIAVLLEGSEAINEREAVDDWL